MTAYVLRVGSRFIEWNPAQQRWTLDAGDERFATTFALHCAVAFAERLQTDGRDVKLSTCYWPNKVIEFTDRGKLLKTFPTEPF